MKVEHRWVNPDAVPTELMADQKYRAMQAGVEVGIIEGDPHEIGLTLWFVYLGTDEEVDAQEAELNEIAAGGHASPGSAGTDGGG